MKPNKHLEKLVNLKKNLPHNNSDYRRSMNDKELVDDFIKNVKRDKNFMEVLKRLGND